MKRIFLLMGCFLISLSAQAQWQRGTLHSLKKTAHLRNAFPRQTLNQLLQKKIAATNPRLLIKSTCTLKMSPEEASIAQHWENPAASAFIFEEKYNGKTYLWGATASHYSLTEPFLEDPQTGKKIPVQLVAQGHYAYNDVSLFLIPPQLQKHFKALKLAAHAPQKGDKLFSVGYFNDNFQVEKNRIVTKVLPARILTSLPIEDNLSREGACGGPVLNKQAKIVGMHVGSSVSKQAGFMVPVENIYQILQAYHNNAKLLRPLYLNGHSLGTININEHIQTIETWKENHLQERFLTYQDRSLMDYDHLEKLIDTTQADKVILIIERKPFSMLEKDQQTHLFEITYDLRNFHIARRNIK